jgi:hypothetical protein
VDAGGNSSIRAAQKVPKPEIVTTQIRSILEAPRTQDLNYITEGTYKGERKKFSLTGQVISEEEEGELSDEILSESFIEFASGTHAFKLFLTTTDTIPPETRIGVTTGNVNKLEPENIDSLLDPEAGGFVYINIKYTESGEIESIRIENNTELPETTEINLYILIGIVELVGESYKIDSQNLLGDVIVRRYNICENGLPAVDYMLVASELPVEISV